MGEWPPKGVEWFYSDESCAIACGDCRNALSLLPADSVDAIATDPPYGLEFMGKEWDKLGAGVESTPKSAGGFGKDSPTNENAFAAARIRYGKSVTNMQEWHRLWAVEALRVLKPGGHALVFGGTRTHHRLMCGLEDAGFEIRDCLMWVYGQGFPKSLNVSCKCKDSVVSYAQRERAESTPEYNLRPLLKADLSASVSEANQQGQVLLKGLSEQGSFPDRAEPQEGTSGSAKPSLEGRRDLQTVKGELHRSALHPLPSRFPTNGPDGRLRDGASPRGGEGAQSVPISDGSSPSQQPSSSPESLLESRSVRKQQRPQESRSRCETCGGVVGAEGLGTALKPAFEPIVLCRKPLEKGLTVAQNVLKWGTGALNIDGCRIGSTVETWPVSRSYAPGQMQPGHNGKTQPLGDAPAGRWPANLILSYPEDEYQLRNDVTPEEQKELIKWMYENA